MRYTESQLNSESLDQPVFQGIPKKLFICSTPRSGSYLLCRYMINTGLGVPHEYFNPIIMRQMAPRLGLGSAVKPLQWRPRSWSDRLPFRTPARAAEETFLQHYLAVLMPIRCQMGIFAAKIHFDHLIKVLDNPTGRHLLDGAVFVYLYREDLLNQAVSAQFAYLTGRWGIDEEVTTTPADSPDFFNVRRLGDVLDTLAEHDRGWRVFLSRNTLSPIIISYERLCTDPYSFLDKVANRLGIDPGVIRRDYAEGKESRPHDPALPSKSEVARHFVTTVRTVRDAEPVITGRLSSAPAAEHERASQ